MLNHVESKSEESTGSQVSVLGPPCSTWNDSCHPNPSPVTPVPPSYPFSGFKSVKLSHEARVAAVHTVPFPEKTGNLLQGVGGNPWKSNSCCTVVP